MKKRLILGMAALAAVTLTSCQKDQVINQVPQEQAIEFGTYLGRDAQTKGTVLTTDGANSTVSLLEKGFGVFAYYTNNVNYNSTTHKPNFMYNQQVTGTLNDHETPSDDTDDTYDEPWTYTPVKYWPNNDGHKLSFMAYAPWDAGNTDLIKFSNNNVTGDATLTYTVPSDGTDHIDLTYATDGTVENVYDDSNNNLLNLGKGDIDDVVNFTFKHALTRIGFKAEAVIDEVNGKDNGEVDADSENNDIASGTTISISSITITGDFNNRGTLNLKTGAWSDQKMTAAPDPVAQTSYTLSSSNNDLQNNTSIGKTKTIINKESEYLMILPQNFTGANMISISVTYTVTTEDDKLDGEQSSIENTITSDPFNFNFQQGKSYFFVLHLGMTSVKFDATVSEWDTPSSDIVVNVPNNN